MDKERLQAVSDAIVANPVGYDQHSFGSATDFTLGKECGTQCCIAGYAAALLAPEEWAKYPYESQEIGRRVLGLTIEEMQRLFNEPEGRSWEDQAAGWGQFLAEYYSATTPEERADIARRRIALFIETDGQV